MKLNSSVVSRTIIGAALMVALLVAVLPSQADLISYSITCTSATMDVVSATSGGSDFGSFTVTANGEVIGFINETSPFGEDGPYTVTYTLPAGDYTIVATWTNDSTTTETVTVDLSCAGEPVVTEYGRICFGPGEVASAVYLYPDRLNIYSIANDEGNLSIAISTDDLFSVAPDPAGDVVIATANDVLPTTLYRQIDGNFRVVVGPEPLESKSYECVFNVGCSKTRSWLPGERLAPLQLSCPVSPVSTAMPSKTPEVTPIVTRAVDE